MEYIIRNKDGVFQSGKNTKATLRALVGIARAEVRQFYPDLSDIVIGYFDNGRMIRVDYRPCPNSPWQIQKGD